MINKKWSNKELETLKSEFPCIDLDLLSKKIKRSKSSIYNMARKLKLYRNGKYNHLNNEIQKLYLQGLSSSQIAKKLKIKSHSIIQRHLKKMGVKLRSIKESIYLRQKNGGIKSWCKGLSLKNSPKVRDMALKNSIVQKEKGICGEEHPNWKGGLSFEPYDLNFNNRFKRTIRKRDNQICMLCGIHREKVKNALEVHHIDYNKKLSIPQNCISLCKCCHSKTNWNRNYWIKFFQAILYERYGYKYSENSEPILKLGVKNAL